MCFYTTATLQVVAILVTKAPKILEMATWFIKNVSLNQKSWLPNGDQKNLTWRVVHDTAKFKNIPALSQKSCSLNFAF